MGRTRAKFVCTEVSKRTGWGGNKYHYAAKFNVVTTGSSENESFFASTPTGMIEISTLKEDQFEVGKSYYVDFTLVE
jgi:hypothetical protein